MARAERAEKSDFDRYLNYKAMHSGWITFRAIYWAIYLLLLGSLLIVNGETNLPIEWPVFYGIALVLLAIMVIIYGAAETLHHKMMRRHA
ncbi:MAG: hypothetical protein ACP5T4_00810 [Candidatus Micrarchaeia archaeon]